MIFNNVDDFLNKVREDNINKFGLPEDVPDEVIRSYCAKEEVIRTFKLSEKGITINTPWEEIWDILKNSPNMGALTFTAECFKEKFDLDELKRIKESISDSKLDEKLAIFKCSLVKSIFDTLKRNSVKHAFISVNSYGYMCNEIEKALRDSNIDVSVLRFNSFGLNVYPDKVTLGDKVIFALSPDRTIAVCKPITTPPPPPPRRARRLVEKGEIRYEERPDGRLIELGPVESFEK